MLLHILLCIVFVAVAVDRTQLLIVLLTCVVVALALKSRIHS